MVFAVVFVVVCCTPLAAETGEEAESVASDLGFSEDVEINLVNIDVYVRDRKGKPVIDLTAEDFVVREDGEIREITNFTMLDEQAFRRADERAVPGVPVGVTEAVQGDPAPVIRPTWVVLYIDQENLHPLDRTRVLRRVREFVTESLIPPVQMMVVAFEGSLKVKQSFTSDGRQVVSVIRGLSKYSGGWVDRESARTDLVDRMRDLKAEMSHGSGGGAKGNRQLFQEVIAYARE
ncbi:MAG: hypothetical protein DRJ61_14295, partial [Acidobacteria bacterium]